MIANFEIYITLRTSPTAERCVTETGARTGLGHKSQIYDKFLTTRNKFLQFLSQLQRQKKSGVKNLSNMQALVEMCPVITKVCDGLNQFPPVQKNKGKTS